MRKPANHERSNQHTPGAEGSLAALQNHLGNRALQRLLAQRSGDGAFDLDDATASRINQSRGGGQALNTSIQQKMGESMDTDFNDVSM